MVSRARLAEQLQLQSTEVVAALHEHTIVVVYMVVVNLVDIMVEVGGQTLGQMRWNNLGRSEVSKVEKGECTKKSLL